MKITHFETSSTDRKLWESISTSQDDAVSYVESGLSLDTATQAQDVEAVTVFVNSIVTAEVIDSLPNLKLIVTRSTGFDHIDVKHAQSKGITVCNVPSYGSRTVAEFAFALILALSRKTFYATKQIKESNNWDFSNFEGFNLQGKTLGIVGTGRIGLNVAQIARGFDMSILANDAFPNQAAAEQYGFSYVTLDELLNRSDVVTLHVPALPETHHLINSTNISKLKKGALLINTSRGDVVESEALLQGLEQGYLSGVGLDVLEGEHELKEEAEFMSAEHPNLETMKTLLEGHQLMQHPKAIVTPHIAFNTTEARMEILNTVANVLQSFKNGQPLNIIKPV